MATEAGARHGLFYPLHGLLLSFPIALFTGGLAADITYLRSPDIQWSNFASWMIAGALVFGGLVLVAALIGWLAGLRRPDGRGRLIYLFVVAAMWIVGFLNALQHSRDAWSSVEAPGLLMSIVSTILALVAGWMLFSRPAAREIVR